MKFWIFIFSLFCFQVTQAQELNCQVNIQTPQMQGVDRSLIDQLRQDIMQYMNNRKWTNDQFEPNEKIRCSINLILKSPSTSGDRFEGTANIQVIRPVYNATYETVSLNFQDQYFHINYIQSQNLVYSETNYETNLTALLNYYALIILGFEYDSFSPSGGTKYFTRAQNIVNLAAQGNETGWKAFDGDGRRNRYWIVENALNSSYKVFREAIYKYHRLGLDVMEKDVNAAREKIVEALEDLSKMYSSNPNVFLIPIFADSKGPELINIFKNAYPEIQRRFIKAMEVLDPSKLSNYSSVLQK